MHSVPCTHILVIRINKILLDHLDRMYCKRIRVIAVCCRNISLNSMCKSIHTCMSNKLFRHCLCKLRINDSNVRCDLKVSDRVFDSLIIICDDRECCNLCCCSRSRGNCTEMSFCSKCRKSENLTHIFECTLRIFVFDPHSLCSIYR